jgi:hypothetical protein
VRWICSLKNSDHILSKRFLRFSHLRSSYYLFSCFSIIICLFLHTSLSNLNLKFKTLNELIKHNITSSHFRNLNDYWSRLWKLRIKIKKFCLNISTNIWTHSSNIWTHSRIQKAHFNVVKITKFERFLIMIINVEVEMNSENLRFKVAEFWETSTFRL